MVPALKSTVYDDDAYADSRWVQHHRRQAVGATPSAVPKRRRIEPGGAELPQARRRPMNPFVVLPVLGLLLLSAGMGFVAQRIQVMTMGYALAEAKQELAALQQEHARLTVEVARSRSLERVELLARTRLGMVDAEPTAAIVLTPRADELTARVEAADASAKPSPLAALGDWLHARFSTTAEAGGR